MTCMYLGPPGCTYLYSGLKFIYGGLVHVRTEAHVFQHLPQARQHEHARSVHILDILTRVNIVVRLRKEPRVALFTRLHLLNQLHKQLHNQHTTVHTGSSGYTRHLYRHAVPITTMLYL